MVGKKKRVKAMGGTTMKGKRVKARGGNKIQKLAPGGRATSNDDAKSGKAGGNAVSNDDRATLARLLKILKAGERN